MKKTLANTMLTTGAALTILTLFMFIMGIGTIQIKTVFQIVCANIVINFGLLLKHKFEMKNIVFDIITDVSYIVIILIAFGLSFDWYSLAPVWLLVVMAVVIYFFVIVTNVTKIRKETREINELLRQRRDKETGAAS